MKQLFFILIASVCFAQTNGVVVTQGTVTGAGITNTALPLVILTKTLPNGTQATPYAQTISVTGGVPPYTFALDVPLTLPPGLSLGSGTGQVSGTPSTPGTYNFQVDVSDSQTPAATANQQYTITISPNGGAGAVDFRQFFGMQQHTPPGIGNAVAVSVPISLLRVWGTGCQWMCVEFGTAGTPNTISINWTGWDQQVALANQYGAKLMITLGQVPTFISAHNDVTVGQRPFEFSIVDNSIVRSIGGTVSLLTNFRNFYNVGDTVTVSGVSGCTTNPNGTFMVTAVGSNNNYPPTYSVSFANAGTAQSNCGTGGTIIDTTLNPGTNVTKCSGTGSNGTSAYGQKGGCFSLIGVNQDGTGTDAYLTDSTSTNCTVTINGVLQAGGQPCGFFYWFVKHYSATGDNADPNKVIAYLEPPCGNEPQGATYCLASVGQIARMASDLYSFIKGSARSDIKVTTPAPSGGINGPSGFFNLYTNAAFQPFADPLSSADVIDWHGYSWSTQPGVPQTEDIITLTGNVNTVLNAVPSATGKPHIDSEWSWGAGPWAVGCDQAGPPANCGPQGPNSTTVGDAVTANHAGWIAESLLLQACQGYSAANWFAWDNSQGSGLVNTTPVPLTLEPSGTTYGVIRDWLANATISATCVKNTTTKDWTLGLTKAGGFSALVVWNQTLANVGSFTIPAATYTGWYDISGNFHAISSSTTSVPDLYDPIMLVNQNPPVIVTSSILPGGFTSSAYSTSLTESGGTAPFAWKEVSVPTAFPSGIGVNGNGLVSGSTTLSGTFTPQVRVIDVNGNSDNANLTLSITASTGADNRYCGPGDAPLFGTTDGPANLPTACVYTAIGTTAPSNVQTVASDCSNFQTLLNAITPGTNGEWIKIPSTATCTGQFTVPSVAGFDALHWLWITTDQTANSSFPVEGNRASPCQIGLASLPGRPAYPCTTPARIIPLIQCNTANCQPIKFAAGAKFIRFVGLELAPAANTNVNNALVSLSGTDHVIFDRVVMHGPEDTTYTLTTKGGVSGTGATYSAVIDSYLYDFVCTGSLCTDSWAVTGGLGSVAMGPLKVVDNFLEASGESWIFGGGGATVPESDIELRRNHSFKPLQWLLPKGGTGNHPEIKNLGECKNCVRVLYEGNLAEDNWTGWQGDQPGTAWLLTPKNQSGQCPLCIVTDVTVRYNIIRHAVNGIGIATALSDTGAASLGIHRVSVHDDIMDDLDAQNWSNATNGCCNGGFTFKITNGQTDQTTVPSEVTINHVTGLGTGWSGGALTGSGSLDPNASTDYFPNIIIENTVGPQPFGVLVGGSTTFYAGGVAAGLLNFGWSPPSSNCTYTWGKNLLINGVYTGQRLNDPIPSGTCGTGGETCEPSSGYAPYFTNINLQNTGLNVQTSPNCTTAPGDCHILAPYNSTAGTDGLPIGANVDLVNQYTQGVQ